MSLEEFNSIKNDYERSVKIVKDSKEQGNTLLMHYSKQEGVYHIVAFSMSNKRGNSHQYETNIALAKFIGKACDEMKEQIVDRAIKLQEIDLKNEALSLKAEAKRVIDIAENYGG